MPIGTGNHPAALWPGVRKWFGANYSEHPMEYPGCFEVVQSRKNYEEDVERTGFGLATIKGQGESVSYDSESQGWTKRYTHTAYALGFIVTREELDDNLYKERAFRRAQSLAFSMRQTVETVAANVYNNAFSGSYTGGDGSALCVTNHSTLDGTQSNTLSSDADLSEASLEDMLTNINNATNSRGLKIAIRARKLLIPPALVFEAERILNSNLRPGTANNDINAVRNLGLIPEGAMVNHYFTDTDAWFLKTDVPGGMTFMNRVSVELSNDNDFDTMNAKAKAYMRFDPGWTDWRTIFATQGA